MLSSPSGGESPSDAVPSSQMMMRSGKRAREGSLRRLTDGVESNDVGRKCGRTHGVSGLASNETVVGQPLKCVTVVVVFAAKEDATAEAAKAATEGATCDSVEEAAGHATEGAACDSTGEEAGTSTDLAT